MKLHPDTVWFMGDNGKPVVLCHLGTGEPVLYGRQMIPTRGEWSYAVTRDRDPVDTPRHILSIRWSTGVDGTTCLGNYSERNSYPIVWAHGEGEVAEIWLHANRS